MMLTVEKLEFLFLVLHYAQNLLQNQTYPSTSGGGECGRGGRERERLRSASHKYVTNAILFKGQLHPTNLSVLLNS